MRGYCSYIIISFALQSLVASCAQTLFPGRQSAVPRVWQPNAPPHVPDPLPISRVRDVLYQTPRQLRYAKRQRLNTPTPTAHERSHAPLQASQDAVLQPDHDQLPEHADHADAVAAIACAALQENNTLSNGSHSEVAAEDGDAVNTRPSQEYPQVELDEDQDEEESDGPIFTPLPRTPPPCRERVEHL
ncbi:hypothetical protein NUW54_g5010 [Trametes sanguinea]|uniref:Uncharacterized protein n=1 Tax=Trametes sanguinea TaxID=158606 RepID=A0ACC1PXV8_9APHY|nr:hypothetical protein NUW54_g5010 [Trametes sanguinea]